MIYVVRRFDDRRLALVADDGGPGDVDAHVWSNLQLNGLVADLGDRAEEAAGGHDLVADLERGQEGLDLLLPVFHRQEDHEIEDREDEREWNELDERADLSWRAAERQEHSEKGIRRGHEINARRVKVRWKPCLKSSNLPNAIASLIRRMVSR